MVGLAVIIRAENKPNPDDPKSFRRLPGNPARRRWVAVLRKIELTEAYNAESTESKST